MKSHPQKNTLLKNSDANAKGIFFKRVECVKNFV